MRIAVRVLTLMAATLALAVSAVAQSSRPQVAVLNFDYGTLNHWWSGTQDVGAGIADLIVDGLVEDGTYRVI